MKRSSPVLQRDVAQAVQDQLSSPPRERGRNDESSAGRREHPFTQTPTGYRVTAWPDADEPSNFHHPPQPAGESCASGAAAGEADDEQNVNDDEQTVCDGRAFDRQQSADRQQHSPESEQVMKAPDADDNQPTQRRNTQQLPPADLERLLTCLSLGLSMRQAASLIGCHQSTLVKRAKRDPALAKKIEHARMQARSEPLMQVYRASRNSWRAAAWLVSYLDSRDQRGKKIDKTQKE